VECGGATSFRAPVFFPGVKFGVILVVPMKIGISIDDGLLQEADEAAKLMGPGRSRLFALAVSDFLQRQRVTA